LQYPRYSRQAAVPKNVSGGNAILTSFILVRDNGRGMFFKRNADGNSPR
jgi:hypothetical protein